MKTYLAVAILFAAAVIVLMAVIADPSWWFRSPAYDHYGVSGVLGGLVLMGLCGLAIYWLDSPA